MQRHVWCFTALRFYALSHSWWGKSILPSQSLSSSDLSRQIQHACIHSFSPSLSLCICMVFICMVQCLCFALIWSHAADLQHTNTHMSFFPRSHYVCLVTTVGLVQRPLKAMSGIFPPPSFFSLFSFSLPLFLSRSLTLDSIIYGEGQPVARRSLSFSSVESLLLGQFCRSGQNDPAVVHSWRKDHKIPRHHQHVLH